jgi:hypothetical protein
MDDMGGICSGDGDETWVQDFVGKCERKILSENVKGRDHLTGLISDGRIILKVILHE